MGPLSFDYLRLCERHALRCTKPALSQFICDRGAGRDHEDKRATGLTIFPATVADRAGPRALSLIHWLLSFAIEPQAVGFAPIAGAQVMMVSTLERTLGQRMCPTSKCQDGLPQRSYQRINWLSPRLNDRIVLRSLAAKRGSQKRYRTVRRLWEIFAVDRLVHLGPLELLRRPRAQIDFSPCTSLTPISPRARLHRHATRRKKGEAYNSLKLVSRIVIACSLT